MRVCACVFVCVCVCARVTLCVRAQGPFYYAGSLTDAIPALVAAARAHGAHKRSCDRGYPCYLVPWSPTPCLQCMVM